MQINGFNNNNNNNNGMSILNYPQNLITCAQVQKSAF